MCRSYSIVVALNIQCLGMGIQVLVPFQKYFLQWDVLNDPTFGFSEVLRWRDLLQCGTAQGDAIFEVKTFSEKAGD